MVDNEHTEAVEHYLEKEGRWWKAVSMDFREPQNCLGHFQVTIRDFSSVSAISVIACPCIFKITVFTIFIFTSAYPIRFFIGGFSSTWSSYVETLTRKERKMMNFLLLVS